MRMSPTLVIDDGTADAAIRCAHCRHPLASVGHPWKPWSRLRERPIAELGGRHRAGARVRLREFCCPACGHLLDTETALEDDPFLNDVIFLPECVSGKR